MDEFLARPCVTVHDTRQFEYIKAGVKEPVTDHVGRTGAYEVEIRRDGETFEVTHRFKVYA